METWSEDIISVERARTLPGLFRERVRRSPEAVAYRAYDRRQEAWRDYTWREMARTVARWQAALAGEALDRGARVALAVRNGPEWVAFDQAALGLGLVVVPLYVDDRPDNAAYILRETGAALLLLQDTSQWEDLRPPAGELEHLRRVVVLNSRGPAAFDDERVRTAGDWLPAADGEPRAEEGRPEDLATIVYTSGTAGRPKGVMLSHHNIVSNAHAALTMLDVYQQDVALSLLPLSHTFERTCGYYLTMMAGCTVAYARSIPQLAEDMQVIRPTVLIAVPRVFERVYARLGQQLERRSLAARVLFRAGVAVGWRRFEAQQGRARRSPVLVLWSLLDRLVARKLRERFGGRLRLAISGGAALNPDVARTFLGLGITVLQGYGLTEAAPIVSANTLHDNRPASVGVPVRGVRVRLGENDELLVRSPGVMLGYWNDHNATKRAIDPEGWLHTGDKARTEEGHIYITGRLKDILVLSNGEKVAPVEMELAITLDPLFDHAMVVGEGRPFLGALLVINSEKWFGLAREIGLDPFKPASLRDAKLQQLVVKRLRGLLRDFPGYAKIRRVTLLLDEWSVDNGLLTPTLKLKREQVLERYRRETERLYAELHGGARRAGA